MKPKPLKICVSDTVKVTDGREKKTTDFVMPIVSPYQFRQPDKLVKGFTINTFALPPTENRGHFISEALAL